VETEGWRSLHFLFRWQRCLKLLHYFDFMSINKRLMHNEEPVILYCLLHVRFWGGIEDDAPSNPRKFGHGFEDANPDGTDEIICVINCWFVMTTCK
jgi:hypothetical protein